MTEMLLPGVLGSFPSPKEFAPRQRLCLGLSVLPSPPEPETEVPYFYGAVTPCISASMIPAPPPEGAELVPPLPPSVPFDARAQGSRWRTFFGEATNRFPGHF